MVIVPIRKSFKDLDMKNLYIKPENILTLQNYMESMNNDYVKKTTREVPIGIYDTIKDNLGVYSINYFLDESGKVFIQEITQRERNLVEFPNIDMVRRIYRLPY